MFEALCNAYETVKRTSDAISAWSELYSFSIAINMTPAKPEATQPLANLYAAQGDNETAAKYYQIAASEWQARPKHIAPIHIVWKGSGTFSSTLRNSSRVSALGSRILLELSLTRTRPMGLC